MNKLNLGSLLDITRFAKPTVTSTLALLQKRHKSLPIFSYHPSRKVLRALWAGDLTLAQAENAIRQARLKDLAERCNLEVVKLVHKFSEPYQSMCRTIKPVPYYIGQEAFIPIKIDFYFINQGKPHLFFLQPRRDNCPDERALALLAGIIKETYIPDVFEDAELFLLDLRSDAGARQPKVFSFSDLPIVPEAERRQLLQTYWEAFQLYSEWAKENPKPKYKRPDFKQDQPELPL